MSDQRSYPERQNWIRSESGVYTCEKRVIIAEVRFANAMLAERIRCVRGILGRTAHLDLLQDGACVTSVYASS